MQLPAYAQHLLDYYRYITLYGGRGSAKSYTVARMLLLNGVREKRKVLCTREFQNSIRDSVHSLLEQQIEEIGLLGKYVVQKDKIFSEDTGTEFIFKGVHLNVNSIKSIPGITDLWVEEAQTLTQRSWDVLVPTIREPKSKIWTTYNPEGEDDPTHLKFCGPNGPPPDSFVQKVSWRDNPWFPKVLYDEMVYLRRVNPELHAHVWEGECLTHSAAQIFKGKWEVDNFEVQTHWDGPYFGADWGFSVDPTAITKSFIDLQNRVLYIAEDAGGVGIELDDINELFDKVSGSRTRVIRADNSRPETISYASRNGHNVQPALKWKGSVEDGIEWMKSFNKIIIHPSCTETTKEFRKYSYKIDRLTGDVTTNIVDAYNHYIDSLRYGLQPLITAGNLSILSVL